MEVPEYPRRKSSCPQFGNSDSRSPSKDKDNEGGSNSRRTESRYNAMTLEEFNNTFYDREKHPESNTRLQVSKTDRNRTEQENTMSIFLDKVAIKGIGRMEDEEGSCGDK